MRVDALFIHYFGQARGVAGDDMQAGRAKIRNELDLPLRIAGCRGDGQRAQPLGAVLEP